MSAQPDPHHRPADRHSRITAAAERFRLRLAHTDALVGVCLLAVLAGLLTGVVIVVFRLLTERGLVWAGILPGAERFETLDWAWRIGLTVGGGLLIGLLFQSVPAATRQVGPVHVMARLARHGGRMPWANAVMQFVGGAISIIAGHSVGREGPVIHVGAASASLFGQWMRVPNNSLRTLVACGVAASIAASFNTPLAGVVFAMEVVMFEYTLSGFAPVILAAVSATSVSRLVFGPDPAFSVPPFQLASLLELPWVVLVGLVIGCFAAAYVRGIGLVERHTSRAPVWLRATAAGLLTGLCALVVPEVMGLGYDTVQMAMLGQIGLAALILIAVFKLIATVACGGLGLPGGMIGPMVVIGATVGGALGIVGHALIPGSSAAPAFYAVLGVAAMMAASLQAPLAGLTAMLELTGNPNTILPGMTAVITAFLMSRVVFRQEPLFVSILHLRGIDHRIDPVLQPLERTGVAAVMSRRYVVVEAKGEAPDWQRVLAGQAEWVIVVDGREIRAVWSAGQLASLLAAGGTDGAVDVSVGAPDAPPFAMVPLQATLGEALALMDEAGADVAVVSSATVAQRDRLRGVVSRREIGAGVR
ncbi:MAG: chloride channel protein [Burkholderiaceae bacterium]